jgi:hypothetical protein
LRFAFCILHSTRSVATNLGSRHGPLTASPFPGFAFRILHFGRSIATNLGSCHGPLTAPPFPGVAI